MKESKDVAILMSTYNGELYLPEQIESIISQTYTNWKLYIRDDGSSDKTRKIINYYSNKDNRISFIEDCTIHRGIKDSFFWILKKIESSYYMFCDQDDVWLPKKIELSLDKLESIENRNQDQPCLVVTDLIIVDQYKNIQHESMWKHLHIDKIVQDPSFLIVAPMYTGCTMIFNNKVKTLSLKHAKLRGVIHDQIVALSIYKAGGIIECLRQATILYRQHSNNVIGVGRKKQTIFESLRGSWQYYKKVNVLLKTNYLYFSLKKLLRFIRFV